MEVDRSEELPPLSLSSHSNAGPSERGRRRRRARENFYGVESDSLPSLPPSSLLPLLFSIRHRLSIRLRVHFLLRQRNVRRKGSVSESVSQSGGDSDKWPRPQLTQPMGRQENQSFPNRRRHTRPAAAGQRQRLLLLPPLRLDQSGWARCGPPPLLTADGGHLD